MDSGSLVCGSRVQGGNLRRAMVWNVSLGFTKIITRRVTQAAQETAVMCSYHLFLCRFIKVWEEKPLMGKSIWMGTQRLALLLVSTKSLVREAQYQFNEGAL